MFTLLRYFDSVLVKIMPLILISFMCCNPGLSSDIAVMGVDEDQNYVLPDTQLLEAIVNRFHASDIYETQQFIAN